MEDALEHKTRSTCCKSVLAGMKKEYAIVGCYLMERYTCGCGKRLYAKTNINNGEVFVGGE